MRLTRALGAAAVAVVLVTSACSSSTDAPSDGPTTAAPPPPVDGPGDSVVADPAFAVPPPGKRRARDSLLPADILVSSQNTLPDDVVDEIRDLDGVSAVTQISLANIPIENKLYNLAAVDPGEYRRFTLSKSAELTEQWNRVAGGEVAVSTRLQGSLPVDKDGYLDLGSDTEENPASRVHVGAWAPQVTQIDMVINQKRADAMELTPDNALIISTGSRSPQSLRKPLQRLIAGQATVQDLDVVARQGLDPDAFQSAVLVGSFADAVGTFNYTPIGGGRIAPDPSWVTSHIVTEQVPILGTVTCNKYVMPQLKAALAEVQTKGLADTIHPGEYAGCYYPRFIAGSTTLSNHSFGLAFDINTPGNQRGTVGEIDRGVVAIFKYWGFAWGGDWNYTDPMHFELSQLKSPGGSS